MDIKIESTNKELSANAGLILFNSLFEKTKLGSCLIDSVPTLKNGAARSIRKLKQLVLGLAAGVECLDDFDKLAADKGFEAICGGHVYSSKACGDFLREFSPVNCKTLNHHLISNAYQIRKAVAGKRKSITIDIDSTSNEQHGKKMEGVLRNYKGILCLDTIQAFDEFGIQYWNDVRPGTTNTASGSLEIIHKIFDGIPKDENYKNIKKYFRADRGYCNVNLFNACMAKDVRFVVGLRRLMLNPLIVRINEWHREDPTKKDRIIFKGGRECEIGETVYQPKMSPHIFRVVAIRAPKEGKENQIVLAEDEYDYFAWVTSIGASEMSARKVIHFYRKRGNAENYIKDVKNGLDMHHYPCQKLIANRAYGSIGAFAYNMMKFFSLKKNIKKPQYTKAIRFQFVHLPAQIIRHAGEVIFRFMRRHFKEVDDWLEKIQKLQIRFQ